LNRIADKIQTATEPNPDLIFPITDRCIVGPMLHYGSYDPELAYGRYRTVKLSRFRPDEYDA